MEDKSNLEYMDDQKKKLISIVCPVYNEEEAIPIFYKRIISVTELLKTKYEYELIFTNNASEDRTLEIIRELNKNNPLVKVITLSRNFGYQASVTAGLHHAKGEAIVIIDVDCEDPPEMIPRFIEEWEKGYDIVYGKRDKRPEPFILQLARKIFYRLTRLIADYDFILDMAEFSLFSSHVCNAILRNNSTYPFIRGEIGFVGFKKFGISYARQPRMFGKSNYNFVRMTKFAIGGILSSSTFPLRLAIYLGLPLAFLNFFFIILRSFGPIKYDMQVVYILNWIYVILILSFLSIYIARIHKDIIQRPIFIVDWDNSILNRNDPRQNET